MARRDAAGRARAGSASPSSGTWGGCTTRCSYFARDPIYRRYHQDELTFAMLYEYSERFIMPLSHDEVVHLQGLAAREDAGRRLAEARQPARAARLPVHAPGQDRSSSWAPSWRSRREWNHDSSLDWHLRDEPRSAGLLQLRRARSARSTASSAPLWRRDHEPQGFALDRRRRPRELGALVRARATATDHVVVVLNLTPVPRDGLPDRRAGRAGRTCAALERRRGVRGERLPDARASRDRAVADARLPAVDRA